MAETETIKKRNLKNYPHKACLIRDGFSGIEEEYAQQEIKRIMDAQKNEARRR
jgi:hypothetical protein